MEIMAGDTGTALCPDQLGALGAAVTADRHAPVLDS